MLMAMADYQGQPLQAEQIEDVAEEQEKVCLCVGCVCFHCRQSRLRTWQRSRGRHVFMCVCGGGG